MKMHYICTVDNKAIKIPMCLLYATPNSMMVRIKTLGFNDDDFISQRSVSTLLSLIF